MARVMTSSGPGLTNVERALGILSGETAGGPLFLITAGLHGNEPAGVHALRRVFRDLNGRRHLLRGRVAAFTGNRAGLARNVRFVDEDMNRVWSRARMEAWRSSDIANAEERESRELIACIESELAGAHERVTHLDLHSTSGVGPPFTVIAGPASSRPAATNLGVPLLSGLEAIIAGTLIEYLGELGHSTYLLEGGQNEAASTIDHHESAVWLTLAQAGVIAENDIPNAAMHRARLAMAASGIPGEVEIGYCHRIQPGEDFRMLPGYSNFDAVSEGQLLARSGPKLEVEVRAPWTGTLLMPRYQGQGLDGFFLGRRVGQPG